MGLFGVLVVTTAPGCNPGTAYGTGLTAVTYNSEVPLLFSEIDPVQNRAVDAAVKTPGFTKRQSGPDRPDKCGHPARDRSHLLSPGGQLLASLLPD